METKEIRAFVKEHLDSAFEPIRTVFQEQLDMESSLTDAFDEAYSAYWDDIQAKRDLLRKRIVDLQARAVQIESEIEQTNNEIMKATVAADSEGVKAANRHLIELEAEKLSVPGQISTIYQHAIPENEELYKNVHEAYEAYRAFDDGGTLTGFICELNDYIDEIVKEFELRKTGNFFDPIPAIESRNANDQYIFNRINRIKDVHSCEQHETVKVGDLRNGIIQI